MRHGITRGSRFNNKHNRKVTASPTKPTYEQSIGEDGFLFLDDRPWPYLVRKVSAGWWLYYWSDARKEFVSMRPATLEDIELFRPMAMPEDKARLYFQ